MKQNYYPQCVVYKQQKFYKFFCPSTVDCSVGFLARQCLQKMQIYFPGKGGREGAPVRNDRYSQGPVTIFVRKEYLNTHLSYSKSLLMTLSESELLLVIDQMTIIFQDL